MSSEPAAPESGGGPIEAEIATLDAALAALLERIEARLSNLEAYRAQAQLKAREAEGRPVEPATARLLAAHLEGELKAEPDYRGQRLLRNAQSALRGQLDWPAHAAADEPTAQAATAARPAEAVAADDDPDAPHALARAAVADIFAGRAIDLGNGRAHSSGAAPQAPPPTNGSAHPLAASGQIAATRPSAQPAAAMTGPAFDNVEAAQADVLARVDRLRTAKADPMPPPVAAVVPTPPSLEGTMANVAQAVAATVAAAGRISEARPARVLPERVHSDGSSRNPLSHGIFGRPALRRAPSGVGASSTLDMLAVEAAEIRFVPRPANPAVDVLPRSLQAPAAPPAIAERARPSAAPPQLAVAWEEASVEIRSERDRRDPPESAGDSDAGIGNRASTVLNRFVKALRGEKD